MIFRDFSKQFLANNAVIVLHFLQRLDLSEHIGEPIRDEGAKLIAAGMSRGALARAATIQVSGCTKAFLSYWLVSFDC